MAAYRVPEFTTAQRIMAALWMLLPWPSRPWGLVSELAQQRGVSRTTLYRNRDRAWAALVEAMEPRQPGRPAAEALLTVNKDLIERAIVALSLLKGTIRDIRLGLELILGVTRSIGYISQTLTAAGEQATLYNRQVTVSWPILGEADEIFQGRRPCLTVVDGRSFLVLTLRPAQHRDATTWGLTYLDLVEQGFCFQDLACDGGTGLRAGLQEAQLVIPLRPDLFHLLQDAQRLTQRLERRAYKALETAERARRAEREARATKRRRGRPLKVRVPLPQAEAEEAQALETYDLWCWLLQEIRQALEPITHERLVSLAETKATLTTAVALLKELNHPDITAFADDLQQKLPELLAPLEWLEQQLAPILQNLDQKTQSLILWAWQQRQELDLRSDFPPALQPTVQAAWEALSLFHRSSSLAESLHSWLRPYLQIHRGMPQWLLPLLQLFWNHHRFERGKRAGSSPLQLAGVEDAPSLKQVLDQLSGFQPVAQPA